MRTGSTRALVCLVWAWPAAYAGDGDGGSDAVVVVAPGGEPRAELALSPVTGAAAVLEIHATSHATVSLGSVLPSPAPTTTTRLTVLGLTVGAVDPAGYDLGIEVRDLSVRVDPLPKRAPAFDPATLRGTRGTLRLDRHGRLVSERWDLPTGLNPQQQNAARTTLAGLSALIARFPAEPVGAGAKWTLAHDFDAGLLVVPLATTWQLAARESERATLGSKLAARLGDTELRLPDTAPLSGKLDALDAAGSSTLVLPLDGLMGDASGDLTVHAEISGWKGVLPVHIVADVSQRQTVTRR